LGRRRFAPTSSGAPRASYRTGPAARRGCTRYRAVMRIRGINAMRRRARQKPPGTAML
jgi:hypothetical protein